MRTVPELFRRLARLLALVVLGFSGGFLVIYLLRWEWNRALIAGMFFLSAEVFLAADLLLRRMRGLERRIEDEGRREDVAALAATLRRSRPNRPGPFAWLTTDRDRSYVLVPILLGAGIILSGIAFAVERLSRVTAAPVAEHELARGLAVMALPESGLMPTGQTPDGPLARPPRRRRDGRNAAIIVALVVSMLAVIFTMVFALLTRPADPEPDRALVVDMIVRTRDLAQSDTAVASSLWAYCRVRVPAQVELVELRTAAAGTARMVLAPAPGLFDTREFTGCLQDAVVSRANADVVSVTAVSGER